MCNIPHTQQCYFDIIIVHVLLIQLFNYKGTHEILDVVINATSLPGPWGAVCSFISCSQSIGCLVFLNDTYCTASKRYASSSSTITCPMPYNDSLPGPGVYSIKAYAVLSNGSYVDSLYTGRTELKNEGMLSISMCTCIVPLLWYFSNLLRLWLRML